MLLPLRRKRPLAGPGDEPAPEASHARARLVDELARQAADAGSYGAEVHAKVDTLAAQRERDAAELGALAGRIDGVAGSAEAIANAARNGQSQMHDVRGAVAGVTDGVASVLETLGQASNAAQEITQIALQTRLVAFNASVEAKRAGEAGLGFAVVAEAVEELATKVGQSSTRITNTLELLDRRIAELAAQIATRSRQADSRFQASLDGAERSAAEIAALARESVQEWRSAAERVRALESGALPAGGSLDCARAAAGRFGEISQALTELAAESGCPTADRPYIAAALAAAARIGEVFEQGVSSGAISLDDLFDEQYQPVPGSNPQQHLSRFTQFTDRVLPPVIEPVLRLSPKVVCVTAVDRNGYLPAHSVALSRPQGADPDWNAANCRNRRICDDRIGLAAARSERRFLLQVYRGHAPGGALAMMKDLSAPISVRGRHWGAVRLTYGF